MDHSAITEADIARSRVDPRFKQILLAKILEQLLGSLHRQQRAAANMEPSGQRKLREGALMAVQLADLIRTLDEKLRPAAGIR